MLLLNNLSSDISTNCTADIFILCVYEYQLKSALKDAGCY